MTYFGFLLRFLVLPILIFLIMLFWNRQKNDSPKPQLVWTAIFIHVFLAVIYTTPWDNYLVATRVWYYNPNLVTGILFGYVPIEEYTFFILETILAALWWWFLAKRISSPTEPFQVKKVQIYISTGVLVLVWLVSAILFFIGDKSLKYLSIILFWALPAILPQLLFGADILWHHRKRVALAILVPGTYLSLIDIVALKATTWSISKEQTTGILFFGILPIEEVIFFFITNVLIVFGMTLLLAEESRPRLTQIMKRFQRSRGRESISST